MKPRRLLYRLRDSQFLIPVLFIGASLLLVYATNQLDDSGISGPLLISSEAPAARTLLATIAGSIITVAALVFSLSAVTVQLAGSQYSPRVVHGFLRDRFQQMIVGVVMGSFTYALTALAVLGSAEAEAQRVDWSASVAVVLALFAAVSIVAYIDHITRRVRIDDTIRRIAVSTEEVFRELAEATSSGHAPGGAAMNIPVATDSWNIVPDTDTCAVRAAASGFVQGIDVEGAVDALPDGAIARLDIWVGSYVTVGHRLFTVWLEEDRSLGEEEIRRLVDTVALDESRTIEADPGFGIRQLVDIALRALSPGVNDPATAGDVVRHLAGPLRAAYLYTDPHRVVATDGVRLAMPHAPTAAQRVEAALEPIRRAAADQLFVLETIVATVRALVDDLEEQGFDGSALVEVELAAQKDLDLVLG